MATGISLHIGVNLCSAEHYNGWTGPLAVCESDAKNMNEIATHNGYATQQLLTQDATRDNVVNALHDAAKRLDAGDVLFVSYSGHGGQVPDINGDEEDAVDETWCLYDGQLIDDELGELWALFKPGVRILMISDSCHSGTVNRGALDALQTQLNAPTHGDDPRRNAVPRMMPDDAAFKTFRGNVGFYTKVMQELPETPSPIRATVQLFSGCQDDQLSYEDAEIGNGYFTTALRKVWNNGNYDGGYDRLYQDILKIMPEWQRPNHSIIGGPNPEFERQQAFKI